MYQLTDCLHCGHYRCLICTQNKIKKNDNRPKFMHQTKTVLNQNKGEQWKLTCTETI